jgi:hypothetical protein
LTGGGGGGGGNEAAPGNGDELVTTATAKTKSIIKVTHKVNKPIFRDTKLINNGKIA